MKNLTPNLMVEDVNATVTFYERVLGFHIIESVLAANRPSTGQWQFAIINLEGVTIMLQDRRTLVEDIPEFADKQIGGTMTLYIHVEDVRGLFENVKSQVDVLKEGLYETFYGTTEFTMRDPNGYILTFAQGNG